MTNRVIGLTGRKRAGKDTVADVYAEIGYTKMAFANRLKDLALELDPWIVSEDQFRDRLGDIVGREGWEAAKEISDVRQFLQRLGTEVGRALSPNVWVDQLHKEWMANGGPPIVVSDVRFDNEAEFVRHYGGIVIEVHRPSLPEDGDAHASEQGISQDLVDLHLYNAHTIDDLKHDALRLLDLADRREFANLQDRVNSGGPQMPTPEELEDLFR